MQCFAENTNTNQLPRPIEHNDLLQHSFILNTSQIDEDSLFSPQKDIDDHENCKRFLDFIEIGDEDTELKCILTGLNVHCCFHKDDSVKLNIQDEDNFECEELLNLLKRQPSSAKNAPIKQFDTYTLETKLSTNKPQLFTQPKKVSMAGRVLYGGTKTISPCTTMESSAKMGATSRFE